MSYLTVDKNRHVLSNSGQKIVMSYLTVDKNRHVLSNSGQKSSRLI